MKKFKSEVALNRASWLTLGPTAFVLVACGGGSGGSVRETVGFPNSYIPPEPNYDEPSLSDPYDEILKLVYVDPYWVASLEMDQWEGQITPMLENFDRVINYSFPTIPPDYDTFDLTGWEPASEEMKTATRDILSKFEDILDVTFSETSDPKATNVIAVSITSQKTTAGFSYFPNTFFEIGMDVFVAKGYSNPSFLSDFITNYDYEVLVHELGHAVGLKHPFEANGSNTATLSTYEDKTANTAMSYTDNSATFNGTLRTLDWMALTKFYGVNPSYNAGNDSYGFSSSGGTFILDGAGVDTIIAYTTSKDVTIDLRYGGHSYLGTKASYITGANQLTISHGSDIENVITGSGNDTVIGTDVENVIETGTGSDTIFAGGGADTINSGTGADRIDLSETLQSRDSVMLNAPSNDLGIDTIYGFKQGGLGDVFGVNEVLNTFFELFPLVVSGFVPNANFSGGIVRLIGSDVSTSADLTNAFKIGGTLNMLSMDTGAAALIISAESQATGVDQSIFAVQSSGEEISITQLALLKGNALDIDQWHADNFSFIA